MAVPALLSSMLDVRGHHHFTYTVLSDTEWEHAVAYRVYHPTLGVDFPLPW